MKKIALFFTICFLTNISAGFGAYFYADAVEQAIQNTFPSEVQADVATEYEAQMDADGNIDTAGIEQVCYAGGFDVSTETGADKCEKFVTEMSNTCVYTVGSGLNYYNNPANHKERLQKCVFDKTMDYVFSYEKGFQQTESDRGNRICDKNGNILTDDNGKYLLGATNMGITTCASGLSVHCIKIMTEEQAKQYYWTRFYRKYGYYKLPIEALAAVMELAVGGTGTVAGELRQAANITNCGTSSVINDCAAAAVRNFINERGVEKFYENITELRANKRSGKAKDRAFGVRKLSNLHNECNASLNH